MLDQMKVTGKDGAGVALHRKVEVRVVIFNGVNQFADSDLGFQLLADLPSKCILRTLPRLDLSSRKLPTILESTVATLRGEDFPILNITAATTFIVFIFNVILKLNIRRRDVVVQILLDRSVNSSSFTS